jgi:hypothetical protein
MVSSLSPYQVVWLVALERSLLKIATLEVEPLRISQRYYGEMTKYGG